MQLAEWRRASGSEHLLPNDSPQVGHALRPLSAGYSQFGPALVFSNYPARLFARDAHHLQRRVPVPAIIEYLPGALLALPDHEVFRGVVGIAGFGMRREMHLAEIGRHSAALGDLD